MGAYINGKQELLNYEKMHKSKEIGSEKGQEKLNKQKEVNF